MKRNLLVYGIMVGMVSLVACGDDDGPSIDPLVGEWKVEEVTLSNLPAEFDKNEGTEDNLYGESSYVFEFNEDMTYDREIDNIPGIGNIDDEGEWEVDNEELELDADGAGFDLIYDYEILELATDDLEIQGERIFRFLPDAVTDTAVVETVEELRALFDEYGQNLTVTVTMKLERD